MQDVDPSPAAAAVAEAPPSILIPPIRPPFGGAIAARLEGGELFVSFAGPPPFGDEVGELLDAVAECLATARLNRFYVDRLHFTATFAEEAGDDWGDA